MERKRGKSNNSNHHHRTTHDAMDTTTSTQHHSNISSHHCLSDVCLRILVCLACLGQLHSPVFAVRFDEMTNKISPMPSSSSSYRKKYYNNNNRGKHLNVFYQTGHSDRDLPVCSPNSVCNKIDTYGSPWVEKQCRCPANLGKCSTSVHPKDGRTIQDRQRQYKTCEPVKKLKKCKYFKDVTWSYVTYPDNSTQQIMHCRCPKNSVAYLIKRHAFQTESGGTGFQYSFACSPQARLRCQKKQPCRLFSVKTADDRPSADEVNLSTLCQCPRKKSCPAHHLDVGVIPGKAYSDHSVRTYSGYCV